MRIGSPVRAALAAAAFVAASVVAAQAAGDRLRVTFASPIETLDPHKTSSVLAGAILRTAYEQLTRSTPDGGVAPGLATEWSVGRRQAHLDVQAASRNQVPRRRRV
jgi:ABC-type oligopeptide transport system substrate-binding subunit